MNTIHLTVAVIIPTFNRKERLEDCIKCLKTQVQGFREFLIVPYIVADSVTEGTIEMIREYYPDAQIIHGDGNWWYTRSINEGLKKALESEIDFILTLNDDIYFGTGYLATLLDDYFSLPPGSIVGSVSYSDSFPKVITFSGVKNIDRLLKEYPYFPKYSPPSGILTGIHPSVVLSGRGILYPVEVILKYGMYDEKLVQYKSETDYTFTACKSGVPVFISFNAPVYECISLTSKGAVYNNPSFVKFWKSLFNDYSINSIRMTFYFSRKHKGLFWGTIISFVRVGGIFKNYIKEKFK